MKEADVEIIVQRAREKFSKEKPRIISDNGPQFIAKDFKEFIRISGMDHVKTSPYYPQSNGKIERWHQSLKRECIRPKCPLSLQEATRIVGDFVGHYNTQRLHSAIGYITPKDKLAGRAEKVFFERDRKLHEARQRRKTKRRVQKQFVKEQSKYLQRVNQPVPAERTPADSAPGGIWWGGSKQESKRAKRSAVVAS